MGEEPLGLSRVGLNWLITQAKSEKQDDSVAMHEILKRFEPLTQRIASQHTEDVYLRDDLANAARLGLVDAVRHHTAAVDGFPGYAEKYMRGAAYREFGKIAKPQHPDEANIEAMPEPPSNPGLPEFDEIVLDAMAPWGEGSLDAAFAKLDAQQIKIARLRYVEDATLDTIAIDTGTSKSAVSQRLGTIHRSVALALAA